MICQELISWGQKVLVKFICTNGCKEGIPDIRIEEDMLSANEQIVKNAVYDNLTENDWTSLWEHMIWDRFDNVSGWNDLEKYLQSIGKKIVFIFDGLETLFSGVIDDNIGNAGILIGCQIEQVRTDEKLLVCTREVKNNVGLTDIYDINRIYTCVYC